MTAESFHQTIGLRVIGCGVVQFNRYQTSKRCCEMNWDPLSDDMSMGTKVSETIGWWKESPLGLHECGQNGEEECQTFRTGLCGNLGALTWNACLHPISHLCCIPFQTNLEDISFSVALMEG